MAPKSKVELYAAIRRDCRAGLSKRAVMRKYGIGHPTVQNALESVWPRPRKELPPRPTRLDPYKPVIDEMLRVDLDAPRKQRHTAKRVFDRLLEEYQAHDLSYGMVRDYVAVRRGEIWAAAGRGPVEAFVPQSHRPGVEAEVDFGDVTVHLAGPSGGLLPVQLPPVVFGQGGAPDLRLVRSGGVLRRPRPRSQRPGRLCG
ncbi:hypothetical protein [Streptomyces sp. SudanB52_2052]|uniref:hypothetical protein n=1 Tax=Streptomyces sp. SudanB52_2052 TaxID=3035276 RepID=UPI003F55CDD2